MNIFITGTESFVGRELISQLDELGHTLSGVDAIEPTDKRFIKADIRSKDVAEYLPEGVDAVIHLAALSRDPDCRNLAHPCFDINVMGTLNLVEAAEIRKSKQFIFASSEWVYDNCSADELKAEDSLINIQNHTSEYALSKLVSENNLRQKFSHGFCPTTVLRFGIIYGPRKANWSAVESLFNSVATKDEITVGSLETGRSFIHIKDIVRGIISSIGKDGFNIINLQGQALVTLRDIIETSKVVLDKNPKVTESNPANISIRNISNKRAIDEIGFEASISLSDGLKSLKGTVV